MTDKVFHKFNLVAIKNIFLFTSHKLLFPLVSGKLYPVLFIDILSLSIFNCANN